MQVRPLYVSFSRLQPICIAPYFDVSGNPCLERLDLAVDVDRENLSHPCAPVVEILSQVTSAHLSRIQVDFQPVDPLGVKLDVYLRKLMDGLPQLDAIFSRPIFDDLTDVIIHISTLRGSNVRDKELAYDLRLCLPTLDARSILGCVSSHLARSTIRITMCSFAALS